MALPFRFNYEIFLKHLFHATPLVSIVVPVCHWYDKKYSNLWRTFEIDIAVFVKKNMVTLLFGQKHETLRWGKKL